MNLRQTSLRMAEAAIRKPSHSDVVNANNPDAAREHCRARQSNQDGQVSVTGKTSGVAHVVGGFVQGFSLNMTGQNDQAQTDQHGENGSTCRRIGGGCCFCDHLSLLFASYPTL